MAYETRKFKAAFTGVLQQSLSRAESIQIRVLTPISFRFILILSFHLCLGIPKGLPHWVQIGEVAVSANDGQATTVSGTGFMAGSLF